MVKIRSKKMHKKYKRIYRNYRKKQLSHKKAHRNGEKYIVYKTYRKNKKWRK